MSDIMEGLFDAYVDVVKKELKRRGTLDIVRARFQELSDSQWKAIIMYLNRRWSKRLAEDYFKSK